MDPHAMPGAARGDGAGRRFTNQNEIDGLLDLDLLSRISQATDLPLNAMWLPGAPSAAELFKAGVARVSVGTALFQSTCTYDQRVAQHLIGEGTTPGRRPVFRRVQRRLPGKVPQAMNLTESGVFVNQYRNERDNTGWHADWETFEPGQLPTG